MPCYLVIDGKKQEMDEDIFDQMVEALNPETTQGPPIQTSTRWKPDGTYDSKPLDPEYFSKYYQTIRSDGPSKRNWDVFFQHVCRLGKRRTIYWYTSSDCVDFASLARIHKRNIRELV